MAASKESITIVFKPEGHQPLIDAIKTLNRETKKLTGNYVKVGKATDKHRHRINSNTDALKRNAGAMQKLQGIIAIYRNKMLLASFATGVLIRPMIKLVKLSADFDDLSRGFNQLSASIDSSAEHLDKLRKATNNTVDDMELMKQANNAMMLGVVQSEDEMAELFDTAQRLGQALGRDTVSSIESLVTGMGRQSRLMLDNLGIIVKADVAYENFAKTNKKLAKDLTQAEKKIAFNTEAMRQARDIVETLGDEVLSTNEHIARIQVSFLRLGREIGEVLEPIIIGISEVFVVLANNIDANLIKSFVAATTIMGSFIYVITSLTLRTKTLMAVTLLYEGVLAALTLTAGLAAKSLGAFLLVLAPLIAKALVVAGVIAGLTYLFNEYVFTSEKAIEKTLKLGEEHTVLEESLSATKDVLDGYFSLLNDEIDILDELKKVYEQSTQGRLDEVNALIMEAQFLENKFGLDYKQRIALDALIEKRNKLKEAILKNSEGYKEEQELLKALTSAYKGTEDGQIALLKAQIESAEKLPKLTAEQLAGLEALRQKLIDRGFIDE